MSDKSAIQWTDSTWNPVTGCTQIPGAHGGPSGCDHCYAKRLIDIRQSKNPRSKRFGHPFETVMLHPDRLRQPYHWKNKRVFVNSLSDVFHVDVPDDFIIKMFEVMAATVWCPYRNVYQILTKRPERMRRLIPAVWEAIESRDYARQTVMESIHLGVSISTMDDAWRADMLRTTPAAVRFLSLEPLLGPIEPKVLGGMDWVIVGGESGPGWRPMDLEWARDLRAYAGGGAGIPFFFKQVAASKPTDEMIPEDLRIREYPAPEAPDYALTHINPSLKVRQLATVTKGT